MKNNLFGFSFVEVIVVVAIISIIGAMGIGNFLTFYKNQEFSSKISNLETFLKQEDLKVKSKEIFDYEIDFKKGENYFLVYENIFDEKNNVKIVNKSEKEISLKINEEQIEEDGKKIAILEKIEKDLKKKVETIKNQIEIEINHDEKEKLKKKLDKLKIKNHLEINIFRNGKFAKWIGIDNSEKNDLKLTFNQKENKRNIGEEKANYELKFQLNDEKNTELNNILINRFDLDENLSLKDISDKKEKIETFDSVKIENIGGKKKIILPTKEVDEVYLFFESNQGNQNYLLIKK
ncbi:hypothetical protein D8B46_03580 [Candidatus Gracilibacteria bacterium]|nr:MAG: hypothetical protein D8B46_03580 [Candidatus Gracilibacteria bacterium]